MKKILFTLVVLMFAGQAWAAVDISGAQVGDTNEAIISFDASSDPCLVRAFSFNIQTDNDANILEVTGVNADYYIYPGTIQIDAAGVVQDYGSPAAPQSDLPSDTLAGIDTNGVTVELASLYAPVGPASPNQPDPCGPILSIRVSKPCCLTITANVSRAGSTGVVMESPDEVVTVNLPGAAICIDWSTECLKDSDPGYVTWQALGNPPCWCYKHQCQGDADGLAAFLRYVNLSDLTILKAEFGKTIAELVAMSGGCADFDHIATFGRPVGLSDLNTLKANFGVAGLADCSMTHINEYKEP